MSGASSFFLALADALSTGGASLISILLLFILGGMLFIIRWLLKDRKRLITSLGKKDDKIVEIIDKYQESQESSTKAMYSLKEIIIELKVLAGVTSRD